MRTFEEAERLKLFAVTIKRVYDAKGMEIWPGAKSTGSAHPEWGESAEAVAERWDAIHAETYPYWDEKYKDHVSAVVELDAEQARQQRRDICSRVGSYPPPCCELAVIRSCVCRISYECPQHGSKCHGSHD